jgi:Rieske Fe-S protein
MQSTGRRRFLHLVCATAALPACSGGGGAAPESFGDVSGGSLSALSAGAIRPVGTSPVCIARDDGGVYAMTLTCTHQGCNIALYGTVSAQGLACGCHGSRFDVNGNVIRGPASEPLQHFAVSEDGAGNLTIHGGQRVDAATRLHV